jgi:hypothetical protein
MDMRALLAIFAVPPLSVQTWAERWCWRAARATPLANGQNGHAGIEPVHRFRYDAAGFASVEKASGRRLLVAPVIDDRVQRAPGQLRMALQVAIEAQQQLFIALG